MFFLRSYRLLSICFFFRISTQPEEEKKRQSIAIKPLELRKYQKELSAAVCSDSRPNTLATCETNSGKTLVAVHAIESWRQKNPKPLGKFAFITHTVALCEQQYEIICSYISSDFVAICHGETTTGQNVFLHPDYEKASKLKKEVFVFTAQTFVNLRLKAKFELTDFTLIVFDECHHTDLKHPFNEIMLNYLALKFDERTEKSGLPQILGLTASPTVFENTILDEEDARKNLVLLLQNMDITELSSVVEQMEDLRSYCEVPEDNIQLIEIGVKSEFEKNVEKLMTTQLELLRRAHQNFKKEILANKPSFLLDLTAYPQPLESQKFEQWIREISKLNSNHPKFQVCLTFVSRLLIQLNIILGLCQTIDYSILYEKIKSVYEGLLSPNDSDSVNPELQELYDTFDKVFSILDKELERSARMSRENNDHKMMNVLKDTILKELLNDNESGDKVLNRGIVFVQKKTEAEILKNWAASDDDFKNILKPEFITADTKNQRELLENFRKGSCRLLFATSVIEEGIDIPDCKLVVNYNNRINHIQQLQQRGRARMNHGKYYVISCSMVFHELATANQKRQKLTEIAVAKITAEMKNQTKKATMLQEMSAHQKVAVEKFKLSKMEAKSKEFDGHLFQFHCKECTKEVFKSSEVHLFKGTFRIVLTPDYAKKFREQKYTVAPKTQKYFESQNIQSNKLLYCFNCKNKLGQLFKYGFCGLINPSINQYLLEHSSNCEKCLTDFKGFESRPFKKWDLVPFNQYDMKAGDVRKNYVALQELGQETNVFQNLIDNAGPL